MKVPFEIIGDPAPKGSRTVGVRRDGSRYTREASKRVTPWMTAAIEQIREQTRGLALPLTGPVAVTATFHCQRPRRPTHPYPSRGDIDKYGRALLDAMTQAGVLVDDRHVVRVVLTKAYAPRGARPHTDAIVWQVPADVEASRAAA